MAPVLRLLAPLTSAYVSRAGPERLPAQLAERARTDLVGRHGFEACVLEAIVTVDAKGRVPLPASDRGPGSDVVSVTVVSDGSIEIAFGDVGDHGDGGPWALDARGRLQLHHGVLRAAGVGPGERLAVVRLEDPARLVLTSLGSLAVRYGAR